MKARAALALALSMLAGCRERSGELPPVVRLGVEPVRATAGVGERVQLEALATHRDGAVETVTAGARWSLVSGPAALDGAGGVRGTAPGTVVVEARRAGLEARASVEVSVGSPVAAALSLVPAAARTRPGGAVAFRARAVLPDGSARDVSSEAAWEVDPPRTARLRPGLAGFLEVEGAGTTEVTVRFAGRTASARVVSEVPVEARPAFPLRASADHRTLVDFAGRPFRVQGDAAWSLVANLTDAEAERYLADRAARGFNTILVNLLEHRFAVAAPRNRRGEAPFQPEGELAHPVDAYFDAALETVRRAERHGMLVLLVPAYLGYGCPATPSPANEGWSAELARTEPAACAAYGRFVGARFRGQRNVIWVEGGDCTPPPGSPLERCALEVMHGLREADPEALQTGHFRPNGDSLDAAAFAVAMDLNSVYWYRTPYLACRRAYARAPALPAYLAETGYEHEAVQGSSGPVRTLMLWASLSCTAGAVFGSRPVWLFGPGWEEGLASPATRDMERLGRLLDALPWQRLVPSSLGGMRQLVTAGQGLARSEERVAAAATREGDLLLAYVPPGPGARRSIVVDTAGLAGPATARWFRPGTGDWVPVGQVLNRGLAWFTTPGGAAGDDDWLLVLEAR